MRLVTLNCNECGAPIEIPHKVKFLTCAFCNAKLQVHHTETAVYSEVLERLEDKTEQIADELARLKVSTDVERLDSRWRDDRHRHMMRDKRGNYHVPSRPLAVVMTIVICGIALVMLFNAPGQMAMFGIVFVAIAIGNCIRVFLKAEDFDRAKRRYRRDRRSLIRKLREID
ncbi:MAG: hypothetical protein QGG36_29880 [Pirellulaceae bacterium]|jgi:uncharacterized Zn finger protein (UPF0148 family)|nr:hypothetical protein [Pirellulaceae bacterium]MDP7020045.1 hypothetical protein [Pirellulaceae bacterium]